MNCRTVRVCVLSLILLTATASVVQAGKAMDQIRETSDRILGILHDQSLMVEENEEERNRRIKEIIDERFDWEEFSKRALANYWRKQTAPDKQEFISLFGTLLERTYKDKVANNSIDKIIYDEEELDGKYGLVNITVLTLEKKEYPVTYRVMLKKNNWYIYDISVKGISLVNNYRTQFRNILRKSSFRELLAHLREKLKN